MKELIQNILDGAKNRIKSPFIFAFICGWLVFNWRTISVFLGSLMPIEVRIENINKNYSNWDDNLFWPIVYAFIYVAFLPYFMLLIDLIKNKAENIRKNNKRDELIKDFKRQQDIAREQLKYENIRAGNKEISGLNDALKIAEEKNDVHIAKINALEENINKFQENFIKEKESFYNKSKAILWGEDIIQFKNSIYYNDFINLAYRIKSDKLDNSTLHKHTDIFIMLNLISEGMVFGVMKYSLTEKGEYFYDKTNSQ